MQLLLFPEPKEVILERKLLELTDKYDKVRKSQYAKIGELKAKCEATEHRLEMLEAALCKMGYMKTNSPYVQEIL